ncbi:helix-turn-helix domain-containing protein [Caballeronia sordidicola]|uniref:Transcriptional regulator, XRE family n=1 Tax=Caballeronia sordidicola TaxID=196367 RepID=A0A226WX19_CABSO|nr:helix-turn-helix domain-containing protein [Caballeronia sordidicola]OXC75663.1 Transcriptional regulator, XRE family [Caballeronia sordidicola]
MKAVGVVPEELIRQVGMAIAGQRKAAGFTQARVADAIGLEKETVSRIENGVIAPTIHRLGQFAELFSCPLSALLGDYRGGAGEDAGAIAAQIGDLPRDDRRAILRIITDVAAIAREREILRTRVDAAGKREAERERAEIEAAVSAAPRRPRARQKL